MISCEQAMTICSKSQYREAGRFERLRLWLHLRYCESCARFSRKNRKLTELCQQAPLQQLTADEKDAMKLRLREGNTGR